MNIQSQIPKNVWQTDKQAPPLYPWHCSGWIINVIGFLSCYPDVVVIYIGTVMGLLCGQNPQYVTLLHLMRWNGNRKDADLKL